MAIDSATKRANVLQFARTFFVASPVPDNTLDSADRHHIAYSYELDIETPDPGGGGGGDLVVSNESCEGISYNIYHRISRTISRCILSTRKL